MPDGKITVPAPLIEPLNAAAAAPLPNCSVAPDATLHDPAQVPVQDPLSETNRTPLLACTEPVLLKTIEPPTPPPLVLVPPVFSNVPALLNVGEPPSHSIGLSFW